LRRREKEAKRSVESLKGRLFDGAISRRTGAIGFMARKFVGKEHIAVLFKV
jgi:hypothetical protein